MPNGKMKPRNLGHVRHRQKLWLKKFMRAPFQHLPAMKGEAYCGEFFSHNDMGDSGKCPHCGAAVQHSITLFNNQYWETRATQEIA